MVLEMMKHREVFIEIRNMSNLDIIKITSKRVITFVSRLILFSLVILRRQALTTEILFK